MELDPASLGLRERYDLLIALITPRPIAWVSTISAAGVANLAPFSFFTGVTANPPTLLFSCANKRDGGRKDTVRNLHEVPEFVVSLVPYAERELMNQTSAELPYGQSEIDTYGVPTVAAARVRPPRVARSPAHLECVLDRIVEVGEGPLAGNVVFGRIVHVDVDDDVLDAQGRPDPARLDTIGRLGGIGYARTTDRFELPRPVGPDQPSK